MSNKWRFPSSGYGQATGVSTGDAETFRKAPYSALAREILQNSIDVKVSDENPTIVRFNEFTMKVKDIPGIEEYIAQVERCIDYWQTKQGYVFQYKRILEMLDKEEIDCIKISDYNTTGLEGIDSDEIKDNKFYALVYGSGVSEKSSSIAGGSKGVGKNAAFVLTPLNMVFYSTQTCSGEKGSIGVAKLISGYTEDNIPGVKKDHTIGTGYFGADHYNHPLEAFLNLGEFEERKESGTDIYIIGFRKDDNWQNEVIVSILDSFIASIYRNKLIVSFNDIEINSDNLEDIIYTYINPKDKKTRSNILSQYLLLRGGDNIGIYDIETEYGNAELRILAFNEDEEDLATHKCVMIRHPLMKIKTFDINSSFRVSAMCIINEGKLGEELRAIENPQHTDWEPNRIEDFSQRKEIKNVISSIKDQIGEYVKDFLQTGDYEPLDPFGAGEFLAEDDLGTNPKEKQGNNKSGDTSGVSKIKQVKHTEKGGYQEMEDAKGLEPDIGNSDNNEEGDVINLDGENEGQGGDIHVGTETGKEKPSGDTVIHKINKLAGVRYKVISLGKNSGKIRVTFNAPIDHKECYFNLYMIDDANNKEVLEITSLKYEDKELNNVEEYGFGPFEIEHNKKYTFDVTTIKKGYFASEVKIICK